MRSLTRWLAGGGLLTLLLAGATLAGSRPPGRVSDGWLLRPADDEGPHIVLGDVTLTEPVISPEPQSQFSHGVKDETTIRFSILSPDTVLLGIYVRGGDQVVKAIQSFVPIRGIGAYSIPFRGILFYPAATETLPDDNYDVVVRAVSLSLNRIEDDTLHLEIDRQSPVIRSLTVTNAAGGYRNGDTIEFEALLDRPENRIAANFSNVSSDTAGGTTVVDQGGGLYLVRHQISTANVRPDAASLTIPLTITDLGGNVTKDSNTLRVCLSNHPPRLVSIGAIDHDGTRYRNGDLVEIETAWDCPDTILTVEADFRSLDSRYNVANVTVTRETGNRYRLSYPISNDNQLGDGDYLVTVTARDRGCGASPVATFNVQLDNSAGETPVLDALPITTRSPNVTVSGAAAGSVRVDIKRSGAIIDTAHVTSSGRFRKVITLNPGSNALTVDGWDLAGNKSAVSLASTVYYVTGAAITLPAPFKAGNEFVIATSRTAERVRIRLWTLGGDLVAELEDEAARDLYRLAWNGQDDGGRRVNAGPLLSTIEIHYPDGRVDQERRALLLAAP